MKKRILSAVLAVCMLLSLSLSAIAATAGVTVDKSTVKAGEDVAVTVSMDEAVPDLYTLSYKLRYDSSLFTPKSCTTAAGQPHVSMSNPKSDATGSYVNISTMDPDSVGQTVNAGAFCTVVFTAKSDVSASAGAEFVAEFENAMDKDLKRLTGFGGGSASVTVKPASAAYSVAVSASPAAINVGETAQVSLTVSEAYSAYQFAVSYDAEKLNYESINTDANVKNQNGTLTVTGFGDERTEPVVLTFSGKAAGEAKVTLTSANIDSGDNANVQDAPAATITTASATINVVSTHTVTFNPNYFSGNTTVEHGADYTFRKTDADPKHYNYFNFTVKVGGVVVTPVDNGDGSYTIRNVTGDVVITATRQGVEYDVTLVTNFGDDESDIMCAGSMSYGSDGAVMISNYDPDTYTYTFGLTIGGAEKTFKSQNQNPFAYILTVDGAEIIGDVVVTINRTKKAPATTSITFTGSGSADVDGGATQTAATGADFSFTLNKKDGYTYTVTAKQGDTVIPVTDNGSGTFTIDKQYVNGTAITVEISRTANRTVEVNEYVKLDGKSMFLVTVSGPVEDGYVLTYNGNAMFWSEKYNAYAYLVISDEQLSAVKEEASALIGEKVDTKAVISYTGDVNGTGRIDVNDAQLVWNMYNAKYASFGTTTMEMFLRADMNGSRNLNVDDAAAIINLI